MKNYENAIKKLEQYGQDHIVKIMEKLTEDEKVLKIYIMNLQKKR